MNILLVTWILNVLDGLLMINNYKVLSVHFVVSMLLRIVNLNIRDSICLK